MRAIVLTRAGSAERLALLDVPKPAVAAGEILVEIHATTVTRGDVVMRKMPRLLARLFGETPKRILGHEFAGEVEAIGEGVGDYEVGDRVFGTTEGLGQGAHAEYIVVPADGLVATIPAGVSFEEAAAVPVGAMTALHFLEAGGVVSGSRVLVNGASGSVGSFAVQIAKHLGAHVTGVSSASNLEMVLSLGADAAIDYGARDFTDEELIYDVVFDAVGMIPAKRAQRVLSDGGSFVSTRSRRKEQVEELVTVRSLLASGSIRPVVDRDYTLEQIPEAHRYVERGRKRGNVVIRVLTEGDDDV